MLSSYGPFKDRPSIPNFEDQSFEEIRSLCYEAKNNGTLQVLLPQISQQIADASYKMSMLCDSNHVNNNLLNMLVNLYNSGDTTVNTQPSLTSGNPFAISSAVNGGQTSSLFGTSTNQQPNPFGGSLFGSTAAPSSASSSSIFGGGGVSSGGSSTTNNFFGQKSAFGSSGTSVFGGQGAFSGNTASSSFGTSSFGQPSASPFALSQIAQPTDTPKQSSIFGASQFQQTQNSIFGAAPAFANPIQPTKPSGLFSSPSTNSIFGQSQPAPSTGLFGQPANNPNQPVNSGFSGFSSFATPTPSTQPQQQSLFGAPTENKSIFGQNATSNQSLFGTNQQQIGQSSNIFANALAQQQNSTQNVFGVQQQQQHNIFGQSNSNTGGSNIFQNQANAAATSGGSIFGGNSGFDQPQVSDTAYSKMEDLSAEDLQRFTDNAFVIGNIPTVPPPRELCV